MTFALHLICAGIGDDLFTKGICHNYVLGHCRHITYVMYM